MVGGLVGYLNPNSIITRCFKYKNQAITTSSSVNSCGTSATMEEIWAFLKENWNSDVWNLYDDKNPTIKE